MMEYKLMIVTTKMLIIIAKLILMVLLMHNQIVVVTSQTRAIKLAVIISNNNSYLFSIDRVRPALDYAMEVVSNRSLLPSSVKIKIAYSDSHCNTKDAPVAAFKFYMEKNVDVFIGPVCDYSLAPVARYAPYWNMPVISPGGFAHDFGNPKSGIDPEFPTLTRVGATFNTLAKCLINTVKYFNWSKIQMIYDGDGHSEVTPRFCWLAGSSVIHYVKKDTNAKWLKEYDFYMYIPGKNDIEKMLRQEVANSYSSMYKLY